MPRIARVVIPNAPHHVVQRGNRRQPVFFKEEDYRFYLYLLRKETQAAGTGVWAYCLMPNHVHLVLVPSTEEGLRIPLAQAHRQYTAEINKREGWSGYLWQGRFQSYPMDEAYLLRTVRYIELNPVRAGLVVSPFDYPFSSARIHQNGSQNHWVNPTPVLQLVDDYAGYLAQGVRDDTVERIGRHISTGRPLGDSEFIEKLEAVTGRRLKKRKPGPPKKANGR
jgi:putative transposase